MSKNFRKFLNFLHPLRKKIALCVFYTVMLTVLGLTPPLLIKFLTDEVITNGQWQGLGVVMLLFFLLPLCRAIVSGMNTFTVALVGQKLIFDVRNRLYQHLQSLSMKFYTNMSTGAIMQRIMGDVSTVRSMITKQTISFVTDIVACLFAFSMCLILNWRMALIVMVILPLYVVNYRFFVRRIRDANFTYREKMDGICGTLQERLSAAAMVKSFAREKAETRRFVGETRDSYDIARNSVAYSTSFSSTASLIHGLGSSVLYCLGCYMVIQGHMGYGSVLAFMAYANQMLGPAVRFSEMFNQIEQMKVSLDRIFELFDVEPDITDKAEPAEVQRFAGEVEFEGVNFSYLPDEPILHDINFKAAPGQTIALVGHTGSGKTTIATLLFRFYDVNSGSIRIDGRDIHDIKLSHLRRNLGVVLQDTILFNDTIRNNIAYGKPEATDDEIIAAARVAEIHSYVETLPEGYDTIIGPGGVKFSSGQSQRLAIARAVLTDPAILVLDEATSSLDTASELLIQQALSRVMANRTSFVIAHRLSTIVNADMILVLDKGRIVEMGKHIELLRIKGGHYRALCREQFASTVLEGGHAEPQEQEAAKEAAVKQAAVKETELASVRKTG